MTKPDEIRRVEPQKWVDEATHLFAADPSLSFDWLSASDEIGDDALRVVVRFDRFDGTGIRLETCLPRSEPRLGSLRHGIAGAAWHERETAEFFGITFTGVDGLPLPVQPLLLPEPYSPGHPAGFPLRKDYVLEARSVTPSPGERRRR